MAKAKKETPAQMMERVRGELGVSKDEFSEMLQVSRQWYHEILNNRKEIPLKVLSFLAVDHQGESIGALACDLIVAWHGEPFLPIGSRDELMGLMKYLETCTFEDLRGMASSLAGGHFGPWAAELQARLNKQLEQVKAEIRAEVAA
jgi:DNA-binding XRE family transcriptional regulator